MCRRDSACLCWAERTQVPGPAPLLAGRDPDPDPSRLRGRGPWIWMKPDQMARKAAVFTVTKATGNHGLTRQVNQPRNAKRIRENISTIPLFPKAGHRTRNICRRAMPTFSLVFKPAPEGQASPSCGCCSWLFLKASESLQAPKVVSQQVQQQNKQNQVWLTQGSPPPPAPHHRRSNSSRFVPRGP